MAERNVGKNDVVSLFKIQSNEADQFREKKSFSTRYQL